MHISQSKSVHLKLETFAMQTLEIESDQLYVIQHYYGESSNLNLLEVIITVRIRVEKWECCIEDRAISGDYSHI